MEMTLILIADPATSPLKDSHLDRLRKSLPDLARSADARWLCPGQALEIDLDLDEPEKTRQELSQALTAEPLDWGLLPTSGRRKKMLLADMESTIIAQEMVDEMASRFGLGDQVAAITRRTMAGEQDFYSALAERVALLEGFTEEDMHRLAQIMTFHPGARTLVATMRQAGAATALVTGGFSLFAEIVARNAGFQDLRCNALELRDGALTGRLLPPVQGPEGKAAALEELCRAKGLEKAECLAVGDGSNDLEMIGAAGIGAAYRGKPILKQVADVSIEHSDLSALLYLQGYHRDEFAAAKEEDLAVIL